MIHSRVILVASFSFLALALANTSFAQTKQDATPKASSLRQEIEKILDDAKLSRGDRLRSLRELIEREESALTLKNVDRWLKDLASPDFQKREAAEKNLIEVGGLAIDPIEKAATGKDPEQTSRCLSILTKHALNKNSPDSVAARKALERLSKKSTSVGEQAAKRLAGLGRTEKERLIAVIEATGARIYLNSAGDVRSISATTRANFSDREMKLLEKFPHMTSFRASGNNITDEGIAHLSQLKNLRSISLLRSSIGDAGLETLSNLKSLDSLSLGSGNYTNEGLRELDNSPSLRRLSLFSFSLTPESVEVLSSLKRLSNLTLSTSGITDRDLEALGKLSKLTYLNISDSPKITDAGLAHLKSLFLRNLDLPNTQITDDGLKYLGKMTTLSSLTLSSDKITDKGLEHFAVLKNLTSLRISSTQISDKGIEKFRKALPNLRRVYLNSQTVQLQNPRPIQRRKRILFTVNPETGNKSAHFRNRPTAKDVEQLKKEPNLETIFLSLGEYKDDDLLMLASVPMKGLVIDSVLVTDRGIKAMQDHPTLESLGIWKSSITDRSLESIARMRSLTKLTIQKAPITDEGVRGLIERLRETGKLKSLGFFKCQNITNDSIKRIGSLTSLERLFLNNNDQLTGAALKHLAGMKKLQRLEIDAWELNPDDLKHLKGLTNLQYLSLSSTVVTDSGLEHLRGLTSLQTLVFSCDKITDRGLEHLKGLTNLQRLYLGKTKVTDNGLRHLKGLTNLQWLGLGEQNTDKGLVHLKGLTKLQRLWLSDSKITDKGLMDLTGLSELEYLELENTAITDAGMVHLAKLQSLTRLNLQGTQVSNEGIAQLWKKLPNCKIQR